MNRNVILVSLAMLVLSLGENLWLKFVPKYLELLGAPLIAIGLYGSVRDLLDGLYQYPGGLLGDRLGRRRALLLFVALAMAGYAVYLVAPAWQFVIFGLVLVMAWASMASPALFAVVGDALPKGKRAVGFTTQAILRRIPISIAAIAGGMVIGSLGIRRGMQILLLTSIVLGAIALVLVSRIDLPHVIDERPRNLRDVWRSFPGALRRLLVADIFARVCEGLVDVFLIVYAMDVVGVSAAQFGILIAVQSITSMIVYVPAAAFAVRRGTKPVVIATFLAFAFFPLAVVASQSFAHLVGAFVVGGLREIGEPSRKSMIVDFAEPLVRARTVGLYYLLRSVTIAPAALLGGLLASIEPSLPFYVAFGAGLLGAAVFAFMVRE